MGLSANSNALTEAKTKISALAGSSNSSGRVVRAVATSCAEILSKTKILIRKASNFPAKDLTTEAAEITGVSSSSSSDCSASTYSKAVKKFKNACVQTFMTCRKEEDASVQLVYTCGSGEVLSTATSSSSSGRLASHMSIMAHSSLQ